MDRPCCDTCRFAEPVVNSHGVQFKCDDGAALWECRRHAPMPAKLGGWPGVRSTDWCGDHEEIAPVDPDEDKDTRSCPKCQSAHTMLITQGDRQFVTCANCSRILREEQRRATA